MSDRVLVPSRLARGAHGAVVAPHHLATSVGLGILGSGGSAVDAAIATNAALAVVMGNACGLGGDAFWLVYDPGSRHLYGLNGSGRAPAALDPEAVRRDGHRRMPQRGPLTITVPGAVRSWRDAHARWGRLPLPHLLAPAIELARGGFPAWEEFGESVERGARVFQEALGQNAEGFRQTYRPHDRPWRPGERVRLPALAGTLERLATAGLDDLYEGDLAERQVRGLAAAGSPMTIDDLRSHASTPAQPITLEYGGVTVVTHPPNSSGVVALELLSILGRFEPPSPAAFAGGAGGGIDWIHIGIEAAKLATADRDAHLSDPAFVVVPTERLLSPTYAAALASRIDPQRASLAPPSRLPRGGGTVYVGAVDSTGMSVSLIESNFQGFGSGIVDARTGIAYHNRGSFFTLDPMHANVLAPRKRPLHTLIPAMLLRGGRPWVVFGSMGGEAQPQIVAQVVSGIVDGGLDVADAVAAPRWFAEPGALFAPPERVWIEPRLGADTITALMRRGHVIGPTAAFDPHLGHCHAIALVDGGPAEGGSLAAATDPRSPGLPAAW